MVWDIEREREDEADAFEKAQYYHAELREIYRYFMPYRQAITERAGDRGEGMEGNSRTNHLFDGTGVAAAFNFAGTMAADWFPPFQDFFVIEAGPFLPKEQRDVLNRELSAITAKAHAVLPRVRVTMHEVFGDLFAGTGAMFLSNGNDRQPVRGQAVPINEIALVNGPFSEINDIYWRRTYRARDLEEVWPKGKFSKHLAKLMKEKKQTVQVTQSTRYDHNEDRWVLRVYAKGDTAKDAVFHTEDFKTKPWITPRFFVTPGESFGRGLGHLGLPFIKTANKTRELALRAAIFALLGIWMHRNDGVFNPDMCVFKAGAMWRVGHTGGDFRSLERLPIPQDFDVTSIVMKDERDQLNKVLLNDELPELQDSVRSPTEIAARLRRAAKSKGGAGARLSIELVSELVQRTVDILETRGMLGTRVKVDDILVRATITSPAAAAQRAERVQRAVDWMQMIVGLVGISGLPLMAKVDELLPDIGRWMGNDEQYMPTNTDKKQFREMVAQIVAQEQAKAAVAKQAPPPPGQQYVNGGAF